MADSGSLGRLIAVHPVAPAAIQRAVFIAVLSFLFFIGMMTAYYAREEIGYFLLATAFLVLYLAMMFAILRQRKSAVEVFEHGIRINHIPVRFNDIVSMSDAGELVTREGKKLQVAGTLVDRDTLLLLVRSGMRSP